MQPSVSPPYPPPKQILKLAKLITFFQTCFRFCFQYVIYFHFHCYWKEIRPMLKPKSSCLFKVLEMRATKCCLPERAAMTETIQTVLVLFQYMCIQQYFSIIGNHTAYLQGLHILTPIISPYLPVIQSYPKKQTPLK